MLYIKTHKILIINVIIYNILIFSSIKSFSQIFSEEQNPLGVKWREIQADGFRLIYPEELESEAQRMANTIRKIYPEVGQSLAQRKTSIPILFQNRGVIANGFVQLAPRKSEFYTTPPQQFDSQDWLNNLSIHELRHVAQFDKLTGGKAKPFPEQVYFAWFGASIPIWFFEGDAVSIETALTHAGRGRQPSWIMPYRAALLEGKNINYSKAYFGSQRDITPGYYQLGYLMASQIRSQQGKNIFDSVLTDIRKRPLRPYPFSNSLRKFTGKGTHAWFEKTSAEIQKQWKEQARLTPEKSYQPLNPGSKIATDYFLPVRLEDGHLLAIKQSKAQAPHFVLIDSSQREEPLIGLGAQEQPWFSYAGGKIVWDEIRYDPRYKQRNYSVVCIYNLGNKTRQTLSSKSRLFSPALSPDGKKIVAIQIDLSNKCNLIELDAENGRVLRLIPNPGNHLLQTPAYDKLSSQIVYVSVSEAGKAMWITDSTGKNKKIISETNQQLSRPVYFSHGIAFNAHYNGINNIYYLDTISKKISALSASKYGAFNLSPESEQQSASPASFTFNNFGPTGYEIAASALDLQPIGPSHFVDFGKAAEQQESVGNVFADLPDSLYHSEPYGPGRNLFQIHSLVPLIENEYEGGLQLQSDNLLNTLAAYAGASYHRDLHRFEYQTGLSFKALYPILRLNYSNRPRRSFYQSKAGIRQGDWRENYVSFQASLPLSINRYNHNFSFSLNTITSFTQRYMPESLPSNFITRINFPMEYNLALSHSTRMAERDIAPPWAQSFRFSYVHQPFAANLPGHLWAAESFLYFPGFLRNHSFLANFNYQSANGVRQYDTEINTVYGYNNITARKKLRNTLLFNYRFPISFPDAEIGPLAYVKNLRGSLFCHYENIGSETGLTEPKTFGFELRSSVHLLRYEPLVDLGARFVFINPVYHQKPILELIFNYSF